MAVARIPRRAQFIPHKYFSGRRYFSFCCFAVVFCISCFLFVCLFVCCSLRFDSAYQDDVAYRAEENVPVGVFADAAPPCPSRARSRALTAARPPDARPSGGRVLFVFFFRFETQN